MNSLIELDSPPFQDTETVSFPLSVPRDFVVDSAVVLKSPEGTFVLLINNHQPLANLLLEFFILSEASLTNVILIQGTIRDMVPGPIGTVYLLTTQGLFRYSAGGHLEPLTLEVLDYDRVCIGYNHELYYWTDNSIYQWDHGHGYGTLVAEFAAPDGRFRVLDHYWVMIGIGELIYQSRVDVIAMTIPVPMGCFSIIDEGNCLKLLVNHEAQIINYDFEQALEITEHPYHRDGGFYDLETIGYCNDHWWSVRHPHARDVVVKLG